MRTMEYSRMTRTAVTLMLSASALRVAAADVNVRGVAPADQSRFSDAGVTCVVAGVERVVPLAHVNDDYCDCDDGRDEPGTTACSHVMSSVFYCDNNGFFPKQIHTSLLNDGICDCCDGTDEFDGVASCANTCLADAAVFKTKAVARLADVEAGFKKRAEELETIVATRFADMKEQDALADKTLASLAVLKERVEVHKAREERRERQMRLEKARENIPATDDDHSTESESENIGDSGECIVNAESGTTCTNPESTSTTETFENVDMSDLTSDDAIEKDASAAQASDSRRIITMIELSDGTKVSLSDYLRLDHSRSTQPKQTPRTADQRRREDFLGPLFNGDVAGRKRIGLYALRTVGIITSPIRLIAEAVLFLPRLLWDVVSSSVIVSPYLESLPSLPSITQSPSFRRLGDGHFYELYKSTVWASGIVWDAPIVAYEYLFPTLDLDLTLPEAESLRKVIKEIDDDMDKLRKERETRQADMAFDYGPNHAFYVLKDQCIEKQVEKYVYKLCPFRDVKQDLTNLGKWEAWGKATVDGHETIDYSTMTFTQGLRCWNGPERSTKVTLECGATNEIVSVDEPSTCVYHMHARSYVACTPEVLAAAQAELAFWSKSAL